MSDYTVIGDVGETLVTLLRDNMSDLLSNESEITLFNPGDLPNSDIRLLLFLYAIKENEHMKNNPIQNQEFLKQQSQHPINLDLYYMLTPYPSNDTTQDLTIKTMHSHWILGRAMQIFHDYSILKGSALRGNLAGTDEELRIVQTALSIQDVGQIWNTFKDTFYRLSVFYLVTPVSIDTTKETDGKRVTELILNKYQMK